MHTHAMSHVLSRALAVIGAASVGLRLRRRPADAAPPPEVAGPAVPPEVGHAVHPRYPALGGLLVGMLQERLGDVHRPPGDGGLRRRT